MSGQGSVFGGSLLIAGSCIGAGMLGLPVITGISGFFPSLIMFFVAWAFMTTTGLLLVEVNQWFDSDINLASMVGRTLGAAARVVTQVLYLFLFYALLTAYIAGSGHHLSNIFSRLVPVTVGSLFFVLLFGNFVYMGTRAVDLFNRLLMVGKIGAFLGLVALGVKYVNIDMLMHHEWKYSFFPIAVLVVSFGFHNMVPTLNHYMGGDTKRVRASIIGGSVLALVIYLIWIIICVGIIPVEGKHGLLEAYHEGIDAAQLLRNFVTSRSVGILALLLALFAILTSFLAQSLSLVHFLSDCFDNRGENRESMGMLCLALLPPLILAILYPNIFFAALCFAGGICAVILFGLFPAMMVWRGRYEQNMEANYRVLGGKGVLSIVIAFSLIVFITQVCTLFGYSLFPIPAGT